MTHLCSVLHAGPNGWILIVHAPAQEFFDSERAAWRVTSLRRLFDGIDVLLRYPLEDGPVVDGDPELCPYGDDSRIDSLPVFEVRESRRLEAAA